MPLAPWTLVATCAILLGAFFVRSLTGFGGAILAIPLLSLFFSLQYIVPVEALLEVVLSLTLLPRVFRHIDWDSLRYIIVGALGGSFAGVQLLQSLNDGTLRLILGIVIIVVALGMFLRSPDARSVASTWGLPAGIIGGVLGGMFGTSGPAYVVFLTLRCPDKQIFRATLIAIFAIEYGFRLALFANRGMLDVTQVELAAWFVPVVIIAAIAGQMAHLHIGERLFQLAVAGLLFISGAICLL